MTAPRCFVRATILSATMLSFLLPTSYVRAQEAVGFVEKFALATDRAAVLKELIPGTEEYYFYHALYFQQQGKRAEYDQLIKDWTDRQPGSGLRRELDNRQLLLDFGKNPKGVLQELTHRLNLHFNHQRIKEQEKPNLPTALDPKLVSWEHFYQFNRARNNDLALLSENALEELVRRDEKLDIGPRRALLSRLSRPDLPNLVSWVLEDLNTKVSGGFGEFNIHRFLLPEQLAALLKAKPALINNQNFVYAQIARLAPGPEADPERNPKEKQAWLDRVHAFVKTLNPNFNSLKASVLHNILDHQRRQGVYDEKLLLAYLKLPRPVYYINPKWQEKSPQTWNNPVDLNADFRPVCGCPPINNDEPLVRDFLLHLFVKATDFDEFAPLMQEDWLKHVFAEAKIVNGLDPKGKYTAWLSPQEYSQLKDRVDLEFDTANKALFGVADEVTLDVNVKNASQLMVKVFEINTPGYYESKGAAIGTDIDLDGLVAGSEKSYTYPEPPLQRVSRSFKFPELTNKRGVWVIEFIGNGRSSRAVIRKGGLQYLPRPSAAGNAFVVYNEMQNPVPTAYATVKGRRFDPDKNGVILIPFSTEPGPQPVLLHDGLGFATREAMNLKGEAYSLQTAFHVDREELLGGRKANLAIRPSLTLNGQPVPLAVLEHPRLTLVSTDLDGVATTVTKNEFPLFDQKESAYEFAVPDRMASLTVTLDGKVKVLSQGHDQPLSQSWSFSVNGIDKTQQVADLHLSRDAGKYIVRELGKNGEPRADRAVNFKIHHRYFQEPTQLSLKTDAKGEIALGPLVGITRIEATNPAGVTREWPLSEGHVDAATTIHAKAGEAIRIPWLGTKADPSQITLLEERHNTYVKDWFAAVSAEEGFLTLTGLTAGDYKMWIHPENRAITLRVSGGTPAGPYLVTPARLLQLPPGAPAHVASATIANDTLVIKVGKPTPDTRVHISASRFQPAFPLANRLGRTPNWSLVTGQPAQTTSQYVSGRDIGDEYRYILDRSGLKHFAGNLLPRPGLLLNPWAVRDTTTGQQEAAKGEAFKRMAEPKPGAMGDALGFKGNQSGGPLFMSNDDHNLDFLAETSASLLNAAPDANGEVRLKLDQLADCQEVQILAVNRYGSSSRTVSLPAKNPVLRDLRLVNGLDPKSHQAQHNQASVLAPGKAHELPGAQSAKFEVYEHLGSVYALYTTLGGGNATLTEFSFLVDWPTFDAKKKSELYSKYACHELSFFLYRKDPAFFQTVILPYLANKKEKTFMDEYLLGIDLVKYLEPWRHDRLNVVERILLAQRLKAEGPNAARHIKDLLDLLPPNREEERRLLESALLGLTLGDESGGNKGLREAKGTLKQKASEESLRKSEQMDRLSGKADKALADAPMPALAAAAPAPPPGEAAGFGAMTRGGANRNAAPAAKKAASFHARRELQQTEKDAKEQAVDEMEVLSSKLAFREAEALVEERKSVESFFRKQEPTKEWAENNYYHLLIAQQNASLVTVNKFWSDYANWDGKGGFVSPNFTEAHHNFTEMAFALAVLDLPFPSQLKAADAKVDDTKLTLIPNTPLVLFHQQLEPSEPVAGGAALLVSQNFYRAGDRYIEQNGEKLDKFVSEEFLTGTVYGCQLVITNPTSSIQKLDLLFQIPQGAMPAGGARPTTSLPLRLEPFHTQTFDIAFYFPKVGNFAHFPVHVSRDGKVVAFAAPFAFKVLDQLTKADTASWAWVSQNGTEADVLAFLNQNNVQSLDLTKIAWRLRENADFYKKVVALLQTRRLWQPVVYSYGFVHQDAAAVKEYLLHEENFLNGCGPALDSPLINIDPIERRQLEFLEYAPLVNARAHRLGGDRRILNGIFREQYQRFLATLAHRPQLDDLDWLGATYYLLLQDRTDEALGSFARVKRASVPTQLQYDYCQSWLALVTEDVKTARTIATPYATHSVDRWRDKFASILAQLDESEGKGAKVVKADDRDETQAQLAAKQPSFELKTEGKTLTIEHRNLQFVTVNYYLMNLEFLFSTNPFVGQNSGRFAQIKPNETQIMKFQQEAGNATTNFQLPAAFQNRNVLVEVVGAGQRKSQAIYANNLRVELSEAFGQVQVLDSTTAKPLAKVYVKVYAEINGQPTFYKDGYTDLRGKFDYATLSTDTLGGVSRFSILILSEDHGAVVREAKPPTR